MLVPGFYHINSFANTPPGVEAMITLNPAHAIYDGHFPGRPVTPGVMQLQIVKELVERATEKEFVMSGIISVKYLNMIRPEATGIISVVVEMAKVDDNQIRINAVISEKELVFTKLKAVFTEK